MFVFWACIHWGTEYWHSSAYLTRLTYWIIGLSLIFGATSKAYEFLGFSSLFSVEDVQFFGLLSGMIFGFAFSWFRNQVRRRNNESQPINASSSDKVRKPQ